MNELNAPHIDYAGLSPIIALTAGTCLTLLAGLFPRRTGRVLSVSTALLTLATAFGLSVWQFGEPKSLVEGALRSDDLALSLDFVFYTAAATALVLSLRERPHLPTSLARLLGPAARERHRHGRAGERHEPRHAVPGHRAAVDSAVRDVRRWTCTGARRWRRASSTS